MLSNNNNINFIDLSFSRIAILETFCSTTAMPVIGIPPAGFYCVMFSCFKQSNLELVCWRTHAKTTVPTSRSYPCIIYRINVSTMLLALLNLKVSTKSKAFTVYSVLHTQM